MAKAKRQRRRKQPTDELDKATKTMAKLVVLGAVVNMMPKGA
jgi:hypothetical protein